MAYESVWFFDSCSSRLFAFLLSPVIFDMIRILFILFISFIPFSVHAVDAGAYICDSQSCNRDGVWNYGVSLDSASAHFVCEVQGAAFPNGSRPGTFSQTDCRETSTNFLLFMHHPNTATCPAGSSASAGMCVCNPPSVDSPDHKTCVSAPPTCPTAGSSVGESGYIDVGTSPIAMPPRACDDGCPSQYVGGGVEYSRLVEGVKHYYVKGGYIAKAGTCVDGEPTIPRSPVLDADGCTSTQSKITMGGRTKCIDSETNNPVNPNSASAVADAKTFDDAARAAAIDAASSAAAAAGLSASGVSAAAAGAAANYGSGGSPTGTGKDPVLSGFCKENPTSKICADDEFGTVDDSDVTNQERSVAITPIQIGSAGVCPAPTPFIVAGRTGYFQWTTYCNFATGIKPILLVFAWLSAAGILIGGFKES